MSNNLPSLLAELSEIAPQICQCDGKYFKLDEYLFSLSTKGELEARFELNTYYIGLPAYDWLQGALMRVIEGKKWYTMVEYRPNMLPSHTAEIGNMHAGSDNVTETLLIVLIQAIKGEQ